MYFNNMNSATDLMWDISKLFYFSYRGFVLTEDRCAWRSVIALIYLRIKIICF